MRKVKVFKTEYDKDTHKPYKTHMYDGWFHCFSTDYDYSEDGNIQYPVAIVESADGKVNIVGAYLIEFINEETPYVDVTGFHNTPMPCGNWAYMNMNPCYGIY